jgi:hypothetical protein
MHKELTQKLIKAWKLPLLILLSSICWESSLWPRKGKFCFPHKTTHLTTEEKISRFFLTYFCVFRFWYCTNVIFGTLHYTKEIKSFFPGKLLWFLWFFPSFPKCFVSLSCASAMSKRGFDDNTPKSSDPNKKQ